ncbi:MAG: hypothetical protein U1F66_05010 [bacterium]
MVRLTAEMIRQHPALTAFNDYIQEHLHRAPNPQDIIVTNDVPNDGTLTFSYIDPRSHQAFAAQLNANRATGALEVNYGTLRMASVRQPNGAMRSEPRVDYASPRATPINVTGACDTVHALGGEEESSYTCPSLSSPGAATPPSLFRQRATWLGQWALGDWIGLELIGLLWKRRSLTLGTLRSIPGWLRPTGSNELAFGERAALRTPMLAGGLLAVLGAEQGSGLLGLHSNYHSNERFALDAASAWGAMSGISWLINRRRGTSLQPASFGASLLSSALVDATLGQMYAEGSAERRAMRIGGFFLPEVYRIAFGNRALAVAETRASGAFTRWGGRVMQAGFYADAAYMIYNTLSSSTVESGRNNLIYRRANQLEDAQRHPLAWALHGAAELVAPSLTQRYWVSSNYVDQARTEIHAQAQASVDGARAFLRYALLMGPTGPATDASFYRELDLSWLRGDNALRDIRRSDGTELPVALVAEQFSDPEIYRRVIENSTPDQQIAYVQRQFRGYRLSREDVREILARISLHHARASLQDLQYTAEGNLSAFAGCFDGNGALRAGQEQALLSQVFPGQEINAQQILGLRRVALARRILELRNSDPEGAELASYTRVARDLGLVDANGSLVESEETRLAQATLDSYPPAPAPGRPSQIQILQGIANYGNNHG